MNHEITILGNPRPQIRHKYTRKGNFISTYDPSSYDKKKFKKKVLKFAPKEPLKANISLVLIFHMKRPQAHFKTKDGKLTFKLKDWAEKIRYSACKKDIDNLAKFVLDACNEVLWYDDKYVVELQCRRVYTREDEKPRTEMEFWLVKD